MISVSPNDFEANSASLQMKLADHIVVGDTLFPLLLCYIYAIIH